MSQCCSQSVHSCTVSATQQQQLPAGRTREFPRATGACATNSAHWAWFRYNYFMMEPRVQ